MSNPKNPLEDVLRKLAQEHNSNPFEDMLKAMQARIVTCRSCNQKNRVKSTGSKPRCGKCGLPL